MAYFLYGLFFVSCLMLIASVLLQPGKTDAGALFTSNISSTAFGPRGTTTVLSKITIVAATVFMLTALLLSMPALTGNISVLQTTGGEIETPSTQPPISDLSGGDANANANTAPPPAEDTALQPTNQAAPTNAANTAPTNTSNTGAANTNAANR